MGRASGVSEAQLLDLPRYATSEAFDPVERLVLDLAVAMAQTPADVSDHLRRRLREHFDDAARGTLAEGAEVEATLDDDLADPRAQGVVLESVVVSG